MMKRRLIPIALALLLASCSMPYVLHPGAINSTDSIAYDNLLIAQAVIDQARAEFQAGNLPDNLKPLLMGLIDAYNIARSSWLVYRNAVKAGQSANVGTLNNALESLSVALTSFQRSRSIP